MSLRTRILGGIGVIAIVLVAVTVAITRITEANLLQQVDTQLADAVKPVRDADDYFAASPRGDHDEGREGFPGREEGGEDSGGPPELSSLYVGVVSGDEVVVAVSPNLRSDQDDDMPGVDSAQAIDAAVGSEPFTVEGGDDSRWRMLSYVDEGTGAVIVLGQPIDSVDEAVSNLKAIEAVGLGVILAALALLAWWVIRLGVRPIKAMTGAATAIAAGDLSQRVPEATPGTEAGDLGEALNQMLASIELSFEERSRAEAHLRQFVADASHELRTPVATIRGYAELYRAGGLSEPAALDDAMARTEAESIRMGSLVEDLLQLARLDQGRPLEVSRVDLAVVARDAAADARVRAPERTITVEVAGEVPVEGDEARLHQVVANLVGNALVHTPDGTPIEISVSAGPDGATLSVADHGPGMDPAAAEHAFERFFRADKSRSRDRGGSGLGLSIVEAIVEAHGGSVTLDTEPGSGTTVTVTLPAA